jgi:homoserine dehydrogenase
MPEYTTDHSFRVYYRYSDYADLDLVKFESVSENYISDNYKYVVGKVSLRELHKVQDELRRRNVFIAAYPND